jgi:hypothetical protein
MDEQLQPLWMLPKAKLEAALAVSRAREAFDKANESALKALQEHPALRIVWQDLQDARKQLADTRIAYSRLP